MKKIFILMGIIAGLLGCDNESASNNKISDIPSGTITDIETKKATLPDPRYLLIGGKYDDGIRFVKAKCMILFENEIAYFNFRQEYGCKVEVYMGQGKYSLKNSKLSLDFQGMEKSTIIVGKTIEDEIPIPPWEISATYHPTNNTVSNLFIERRSFQEHIDIFLNFTSKFSDMDLHRACDSFDKLYNQ